MNEKLNALYQLLSALSRIPGLSFLSKYSQKVNEAANIKRNLDSANQAAKNLGK